MAMRMKGGRPVRTVEDLMQRSVVTVPADMPVRRVARTLWEQHVSGAPVVDEAGKVVGVVSATDLLWASEALLDALSGGALPRGGAAAAGRAAYYAAAERPVRGGARRGGGGSAVAGEPTARDVMTPDVFGIAPGATVPELAAFLVRAGVHRALVLDGGRLVGIVSVTDLLPVIAEVEG